MIRKSLAFFLLGVAAGTAAYAQQTPATQKEDAPRAFAWSFEGDGGYLGVQTQEVTRDNFSKFGLRDVRGVAVEKVLDKSPAATSGIQAGDVIVKFNGEEVTSARKLTRLIGEVDPDHQAKVTVIRNGSEREITVTIGKRPAPEFANGNFEFNVPPMNLNIPDLKNMPQLQDMPDLQNMPDWQNLPNGQFRTFNMPNGQGWEWSSVIGGRRIGISVTPLTKQLADHFKVDSGVMISDVGDNSPAARAGLKAGDIIVQADGRTIMNQSELTRAINEKKEGDVQLTIVRDGSRQTITVTPEAAKDGNFFFQNDDDGGMELTPAPPALQRLKKTPQSPAAPQAKPMKFSFSGPIV
ncbi:MAG TPA: PDZ domain-containing protein [Pyrinomonadaceae bacterium]|nr:PDZ domain-containing protein [Pyrinomonadaceae bacterium]